MKKRQTFKIAIVNFCLYWQDLKHIIITIILESLCNIILYWSVREPKEKINHSIE